MAEIAGVTFIFTDYDPGPSDPRVMFIPNTIDDATVSDLIDTFAARQADLDNLIFDPLMSAGGTEELGGGIEVAKTLTNLNTQIAFVPVRIWTSVGTITGADASGAVLTDSGANFVSDGVVPGASVFNFRTGAIGTVLRVVDLNNLLLLDALGAGDPDNEWQGGDTYRVINTRQVNISGGNDVAVDDLAAELPPILSTIFTQVVRTASSSATTANILALEHATFNGRVLVDVVNGFPGQPFPAGTSLQPCNNLTDALAIAAVRGFKSIEFIGDATIGGGLDFTGFNFSGTAPASSLITVDASALVSECEFRFMSIQGEFDGTVFMEHCTVLDIDMVEGNIERCAIAGTISLSGTSTFHMHDCHDGMAGLSHPMLDFGGTGMAAVITGWQGGLELRNKSGPEDVQVDILSGRLVLANTISAGNFVGRIQGSPVEDNSVGGTYDWTVIGPIDIADEVQTRDTEAAFTLAYEESTTTLELKAWLERGGVTVSTLVAISITWRDEDGEELFTLDETDALTGPPVQNPDTQGVYAFTHVQALADDAAYYVDVVITDAIGPVAERHPVMTIKGG